MLEDLKIPATDSTPFIYFSKEKNIFQFKGKSYPENVKEFYMPVLEWLEEYVKNPNEETLFDFYIEYFNSSSARILVEIIIHLEEIIRRGKKIKVRWFTHEKDRLMRERGEEIKELSIIPFEIIQIEDIKTNN